MASTDNARNKMPVYTSFLRKIFRKTIRINSWLKLGGISYLNLTYLDKKWCHCCQHLGATLCGVNDAQGTVVARLHINQLTQGSQANRWFDWCFSFGYHQSMSSLQFYFHNPCFDPPIVLNTIIIVPSSWWIPTWQFSLLKAAHRWDIYYFWM